MIPHFLPLGQEFIQNLPVCLGGAVKQDNGAGVNAGQQLFEGLIFGGLLIFIPVHVGKAPEEGLISHITGHLQVAFTVLALGRPVIFFHGLAGGLLIKGFQISQFFFK